MFVDHRVGVKIVESRQQLGRVMAQFVQRHWAVAGEALVQVGAGHMFHQQVNHEAVLLLGGAQRRVVHQVWVIQPQEGVELIFCSMDLHRNSVLNKYIGYSFVFLLLLETVKNIIWPQNS